MSLVLGGRTISELEYAVMAVVNRTPDSFYDGGDAFGKNTHHSLELTRRLGELTATGWPVLVALSNKDFVGESLDLLAGERLAGTLAATAISAWHGAGCFVPIRSSRPGRCWPWSPRSGGRAHLRARRAAPPDSRGPSAHEVIRHGVARPPVDRLRTLGAPCLLAPPP